MSFMCRKEIRLSDCKDMLTLYYIIYLSCQRQLTTTWKLGFKRPRYSRQFLMLSMNNSTTANNTTGEGPQVSEVAVILTSIFICIVMLATIMGKSLVIFCVCYYPRLRGRTNYLIVSLAVADWLVGINVSFIINKTHEGLLVMNTSH